MIRSSVTISLVPEAKGGPFVFWDGLQAGCRKAAELGFDGVEVFARSAEELDTRELKRLLAEHRLRLSAIGTGAGWVVRRLRLTDLDASVRAEAKAFIAAIIDAAAEFPASAIIGSMQGRWGDGVSREQALGWLAEALDELGARAESRGACLLYEPLNRYETNLFNRVSDVLDFLGSLRTKNVKVLCDLFHMNIEEADIAGALRLAANRLGHIHLADSNRHAVGFGHTDLQRPARVLREINYDGYVSAEILPLPDPETAAKQTMRAFHAFFGDTKAQK